MNSKFSPLILFFITVLGLGLIVNEAKSEDTITVERYNSICKWGIFNPPECKKRVIRTGPSKTQNTINNSKQNTSSNETEQKVNSDDCTWGIFNPPKCRDKDSRYKGEVKNKSLFLCSKPTRVV